MKKTNIGLFGFGVVGEGIYQVIQQKPKLGAQISRIVIRDPNKLRNAPAELFSLDADTILNDDEIDVVIELIDDAEAAFVICTKALQKGKSVVTANKKMVAENLEELIQLQEEYGGSLLYEAAVCGSIPIIRNLEEYFDNDLLQSISGIVNGSTNYILSQMSESGWSFEKVLRKAQELGFAESDPALDISGLDAAYKLSIILFHAFGLLCKPSDIIRKGIDSIDAFDIDYAREKGKKIKLVASSYWRDTENLIAYVLPQFVDQKHQLHHVNNEFNGVLIGSGLADEQFLYGKGAGRFPTSSAVLSDLSALSYKYRYSYRKNTQNSKVRLQENDLTEVYVSYQGEKPNGLDQFEQIREQYSSDNRSYLIGTISFADLCAAEFWNDQEVSVILSN